MGDDKIITCRGEYDNVIPDDTTIAQFLLDGFKDFGDDEAAIDYETRETLTYNEIIRRTKALAAGMQVRYNLGSGDCVAIALTHTLNYPIATLAVQLTGATAALINPAQTIQELTHVSKLISPIKLWIANPDFVHKYEQLYPAGSYRPPFIIHGGPSWDEALTAGKGVAVHEPKVNVKEDVALIMFSSGTTGLPKGVMLTHANCIAVRKLNKRINEGMVRDPSFLFLLVLPPYHTAGYTGMLESIALGVCYVLLPKFTFPKMLQAIQDFKISVLIIAPPMALQMAKQPVEEQYDLSSIKLIRSGSGAVSKEIIQILKDKFGCMYFQSYGMTETTMVTHSDSIDFSKEGSIGVVRPFCECKVIDLETGESLGPNKEGEICIRGAVVMKGYIGNEEATRNTIDKDGWLHTGDIGYYDEEEFFFITDRLKELIKYNGFQVSPTELEQILLTHPDVVDAAVAPVPDESAGELPRAYVVRRPGSKVTESDLDKLVSDQVSSYKRLRGGVVFIESIPKNPSGKILRRELKKLSSKL